MRSFVCVIASIPLLTAAPVDPAIGGPPKVTAIPDPSDWEVRITYRPGVTQKAFIRLRNGVIYPAINNVRSGTMFVDGEGALHILFDGHPKVSKGEALLNRPAKGAWQGTLIQPTGQSSIVLHRK